MKHRLERVNELLKRELSEVVLRDLAFKDALVTIQDVDVTPDLKNAHVFVSVIGTEAAQHGAMKQLHEQRGELQKTVSKRVVLKYTPHFHFKLDASVERGTRVMQILGEIDHTHPLPPEPNPDDDHYDDYDAEPDEK